jgi:hypothetical protein
MQKDMYSYMNKTKGGKNILLSTVSVGAHGSIVVEALFFKSEGHGFDS